MKKTTLLAVTLAALIGAAPFAAIAQNVAIVNGKPVPKTRMDVLAAQLAAAGHPVTPEMQGQLREEVVVREVFMQEAQKQGLDGTTDYKDQLELARQAILIRQLFDNYRKTHPVTDAEVQAEYDKFVAANSGKEYKARHILVENEDQANKILADLKKGAKFEDIAKKQSKDPGSGANGGDLDWAAPSSFVPEFSEAMIKLKKGETTATPVKTPVRLSHHPRRRHPPGAVAAGRPGQAADHPATAAAAAAGLSGRVAGQGQGRIGHDQALKKKSGPRAAFFVATGERTLSPPTCAHCARSASTD